MNYETLYKLNLRLIYAFISIYLKTEPCSNRADYDTVVEAEMEFRQINGSRDLPDGSFNDTKPSSKRAPAYRKRIESAGQSSFEIRQLTTGYGCLASQAERPTLRKWLRRNSTHKGAKIETVL